MDVAGFRGGTTDLRRGRQKRARPAAGYGSLSITSLTSENIAGVKQAIIAYMRNITIILWPLCGVVFNKVATPHGCD